MSFVINSCITDDGKPIEGLFEIYPKIFEDYRGYFFESYSQRDFNLAGINYKFVQDNQSCSKKGVLRGLHFQVNNPQGKLVRIIRGEIFDVAVDLRPRSSSFGKWFGLILDEKKHNQFFIPPGFAHGFLVLSEICIFTYKCTDFYNPKDEGGIIWNDPSISINWPKLDIEYILSDKDKILPSFSAIFNEDLKQ